MTTVIWDWASTMLGALGVGSLWFLVETIRALNKDKHRRKAEMELRAALEREKKIVRATCHNALREELYGEKLQEVVIFHLENFVRNILEVEI